MLNLEATEEEIEALHSALDEDGDGGICIDEFERWYSDTYESTIRETMILRAASEKDFKALFNAVDENGDGSLCLGEVKTLLKALDVKTSDFETEALFKGMDIDGSGGVSREEFERWYVEAMG